ncbi:hypothetical protein RFI_00500 [Reticulomyxa filosa]|uniref:GOLD domain-containing protein n=1 Tax=Reticulomyxa filosa TaxID=46433 RepID=X6PEN1_RETFI|nr:hypothetical protein RFI_00500 [Reticulomyxa filosa]|eukprot:ETO36563.1 hypothetical protein RFI_00500 [Reticulomyxa filosa]
MPHIAKYWMGLFILFLFNLSCVWGLTTLVKNEDEECFFANAETGDKVHGTFSVTRGNTVLTVKVWDPKNELTLQLKDTASDSFSFMALDDGFLHSLFPQHWYRRLFFEILRLLFCFDGCKGSVICTVEFGVHVGHDTEIKNVMKEDHMLPIDEGIARLNYGLHELDEQISYHRNRLSSLDKITKSIHHRLNWWNLVEAAILISVSILQTLIIMRFFEKK